MVGSLANWHMCIEFAKTVHSFGMIKQRILVKKVKHPSILLLNKELCLAIKT